MRQLIFLGIVLTGIVGLFVPFVHAQQAAYPIQALGNCRDAQECFYYCEIPHNQPACWSYSTYILRKHVLGEQTSSPDEEARKHGITFPIAELNNCASTQECMQYCNKPENQQACEAFGKKKGLIQENQNSHSVNSVNKEKMLIDAKAFLGCDSESSCKEFCNNPSNQQKCQAFAQKEGFSTQPQPGTAGTSYSTSSGLYLPYCTNPDSCKNFCSNPANKQTCDAFGTSCSTFCNGNPERCSSFNSSGQSIHTLPPVSITTPSGTPTSLGCQTEQECSVYCQTHPGACPGYQNTANYNTAQPGIPYPTGNPSFTVPQKYPSSFPSNYPIPTYPQQ